MIKYIIHNSKNNLSIKEVLCEKLSIMEDASIAWLPSNEFKVRITAPQSVLEKRIIGKEIYYDPIVYYNHSIFDNETDAFNTACVLIEKTLKLREFKNKQKYCQQDIDEAIKFIKIIKL